jgi:hypothetical protein
MRKVILGHLLTTFRWLQATLGYISPVPAGPESALQEVDIPNM